MKQTFSAAQDKARELACILAAMLGDHDEAIFEYDTDSRVKSIETEARDGFFPYTSGGFSVCLPALVSHHDSTGHAPAPIQPMIDAGNRYIAESWSEKYPDRPPLLDCILAEAGDPGAEFQSDAESWESEAWQGDDDCYFWKARVMFHDVDDWNAEGGRPHVLIDAYLNTDINYGRDSIPWLAAYGQRTDQTSGRYSVKFPLDKFLRLETKHFEAMAKAAARTLP